ncbi:MAG: COG4223 family protein [Roseovarius sp.]|uniref:COG4223 family protein n=1 Tax=Roseovarius sp. TaxID=1486281 RepID=UPI0040586E94
MARKKKSQTDNPDAPEGAAEDATAPSATAQDTPETTETQAPDTAPNAVPSKASEDAVEDTVAPDAPEQHPPEAAEAQDAEDETTISPSDETGETPPQDEDGERPAEETGPPFPDHSEEPTPVVRTEQVTVRQGGFWSMLIGGVAAAGIGVAAAPYIYPHLPVGQAPAPADDRIETRLDEQAQRISDLGARIDEMPAPTDPSDEISGLSETVTSLAERVANLEVQLSNLEVPQAPEAPNTAALDELRDSLAAQSAEIEDLRTTLEAEEQAARDSARATLQRAALTRVMTALDTGDAFDAALADLRDTGATVPDALAEVAETGVPTRAQLVESFPEAARAALAAARASDTGDGASVGDFLRAQLGIRSLEPREGDGPDAILSRAEAALAEGRTGDALAEIETLPEDARAAMSDWAANATTRRDALAAAEALSAELN